MIPLTNYGTNTQVLAMKMAGAAATTYPTITVCSYIVPPQSKTTQSANGNIAADPSEYRASPEFTTLVGTSKTTIAASPVPQSIKDIFHVAVPNPDTAAITFSLGIDQNGTYNIFMPAITLQVNETLFYDGKEGERGWYVIDANGCLKTSLAAASNWAVSGNLTVGGTAAFTGAITKVGGITTSGVVGVPAIVATGRVTGQTAAVASVSTFTVGAADASFEVSANVNVTTATTHNFTVTCAYTDETNTSRTLTLGFTQLSGATFLTAITNITGVGPYESPVYHIRCKAATSITIATTGTFTSVVYNAGGIIKETA